MDGLNELLNKYMLFASQEVHVGKNCAGQDLGHSFSQYGPTCRNLTPVN